MTVINGCDDERLARAGLLLTGEPGDLAMARSVRSRGAVECWERVLRARGSGSPLVDPAAVLAGQAQRGTRFLCPADDEWPAALDDLDRGSGVDAVPAPLGLWVRGPLGLSEAVTRAAAVVGSRAASAYGLHVAGELGLGLAEAGWTVVSGAALGIDGAAHRGNLVGSGATVAVLAGGIDVPYPRAHSALLERIAAEGLVVSEAPPDGLPLRHRFLVRNRLIAAVSSGTVVVEAGVRSGALSTARHARRLGRAVMAVPGPVTSGLSVGCHLLLRQWPEAALVTSAAEVVEAAGPMGELAALPLLPRRARDDIGVVVARLLDALPVRVSLPTPVLADRLDLPVEEVAVLLEPLLAGGLVECRPDGWRITGLGRQPTARPLDGNELLGEVDDHGKRGGGGERLGALPGRRLG